LADIEADAMHHLQERADLVRKRRTGDDEDDLSLFLGAPAPADQGVDDLGRSLDTDSGPSSSVRRVRRSERESRRTKRKSKQTKVVETEEGYSTDSSLAEGDALDYAAATRDLRKRVAGLLEDVRAEDFRNPEKGVAVKFGEWRSKYEEEYVSAFGGLAMVQAWEFYARSELVGWEPLRVSRMI
jgi:GC-rich sequence DNA-binding factor